MAVATSGPVTVALYDVLGCQVQTLFEGEVDAGAVQAIELDARSLPTGVYVIRAQTGEYSRTQQVTVAR